MVGWQHQLNGHAAAAKSLQLCPTLCDPIDSSPPGSPVPGILQARALEWVAIAFSWSLLKFMSFESVVLSNYIILCFPVSFCLQSFQASGSFLMSQLFTSGGQSIGALVSVLPMNIQGWFPSGLTGLISLESKWLSVWKQQNLQMDKIQVDVKNFCRVFPYNAY